MATSAAASPASIRLILGAILVCIGPLSCSVQNHSDISAPLPLTAQCPVHISAPSFLELDREYTALAQLSTPCPSPPSAFVWEVEDTSLVSLAEPAKGAVVRIRAHRTGRTRLIVRARGWSLADTVVITTRRPTLYRLEVAVTDESTGAPLAGAALRFSGNRSSETNDGGSYVLEQNRPGWITVAAFLQGYIPEQREVNLACSEVVSTKDMPPVCTRELNIGMRPAPRSGASAPHCAVAGEVRSEEMDVPLPGTLVHILGQSRLTGALPDSAGRFRIDDLPQGVYAVEARGIGFIRELRLLFVECTSREDITELSFRLRSNPIH